eukprot:TRINITY_DN49855_c0_g1_i1.p1 TRINITY_DN49855_c0_g1~~TRINITY_DN49855_c0_g1_i1.p1  ORF type:complete len:234 (+),score=47.30 TRINITY_DN49855_c0_g1_i1:62-763(+)
MAARKRESRLWQKSYELDPQRGISIKVVEDPTIDDGDGNEAWCAWCLWPAAWVLVQYLSGLEEDQLANKSVIELGSGCGGVGMYLRRRQAAPVVLTDVYRALPLLKRNVQANGLQADGQLELCALPWGTELARLPPSVTRRVPFDLAVAADCTYDFIRPEQPAPTTDALLASLKMLARRALVCVSRRPLEVEAFEAALTRAGLDGAPVVLRAAPSGPTPGVDECLVYELNFEH